MIKRMVLLLFALIVASCTFASGSPEELNVYSLIPSEYSSKILLDFSNEFDIDVNIKQTTIAELQSTVDDDTWGDIILGGSGLNHQLFADEGWLVEGKN